MLLIVKRPLSSSQNGWSGLFYDWFTEGFDTANLMEAKTLLEKLS